jgi:hypothetical protein
MTEDLSGWRSLYVLKRLTLPAARIIGRRARGPTNELPVI